MKKNYFIISLIAIVLIFFGGSYYIKNNTGNIKLSWDANKEPNIDGYKIYYGIKPRTSTCPKGGYENKVDAGNQTNYVINDLKKNTKYYFSDEVGKKVDIINFNFWKK